VTAQRVAWIGLGEMGLPMAGHLVHAGHRVLGFDLDPAKVESARALGVEPAGSAAEAAAGAEVVVTMLRTGAQTEELLAGLSVALPPGPALDVVVMSTLDPELMQRIAGEVSHRLTVVDAPVSGGVRGAQAATLAIMAAGPPEALARLRPLLDVLGGSIFDLGPCAGAGQAAKLANQVMMAASLAGTLEALELSRSYGVEDGAVCAAVAAGTGGSWVLDQWEWMRSLWESYAPENGFDILIKDLRAVLDAGKAHDSDLRVSTLALDRLLEARERAVQSRK
jgi:3-hydroxyisobutyrate dehydrogenase